MKPWLKMRKKTSPELPDKTPYWFGNLSNGEYFRSATARDRKVERLILQRADENARRVGMDRRDFMASAMGVCTSLFVMNEVAGCKSDDDQRAGARDASVGDGGMGADSGKDAGLCVPLEATLDPDAACATIEGDEFIFDVQTHWFKEEDLSKFEAYRNLFAPIFQVTTEDDYITQIFCNSDTTLAVLTAWPGVSCDGMKEVCGLPLSNESMVTSRDNINAMAGHTQRVIQHVQVMVQDAAGVEPQLEIMESICATGGVGGWKLYPGAFGGYQMTDPKARQVIERGLELGVDIFCVHKGLPIGTFFDKENNYPGEIGRVAIDYPTAKLVIYHSGICSGYDNCGDAPTEGPFDPDEEMPSGVNALIKGLRDVGIGPAEEGLTPNTSVYGEIGSAINQVMNEPAEVAAHFFGKLMKYLGPDHVCWGTDCVIYGSPQQFINWFRTLEIPESMQEQYGYPALNAENKRKILGLNSAKLYGIDVEAVRCAVEQCATGQLKRRLDEEFGTYRWVFQEPKGPKTHAEFVRHWKTCAALGRPG